MPLIAVTALVLSAAVLGFEVALTSIFAVVLHYHAVHLAVAIGLCGLGAGGLVAAWLARRKGEVVASLSTLLSCASLGMAAATWLIFRFDPGLDQALMLFAIFIPFLLLGAGMALLFRSLPEQGALVYAADLVGAALGALGAMALLNWLGGPQTALTIGCLPAAAALGIALVRREGAVRTGLAAVALVTVATLTLLSSGGGLVDFRLGSVTDTSGDKTMVAMLRDQGGEILDTEWNAFGRTDLVALPGMDQRFVFVNGGAGSIMQRFNGDLAAVGELQEYMEFLPFAATQPARVLVIGAGGGIDVLLSLLAGAKEITAVEINPGAVTLTRRHGDYNGHILDRPEVQLIQGDGRNLISRDQSQYDLILLNLVFTQAAEARSYALSENYIFTMEAFAQYLSRLTPGGAVAVVTHNPLEATRAFFTGLSALEAMGFTGPDAARRSALYFWPDGPVEEKRSVVLLRQQAYSEAEAQALQALGLQYGVRPIFLPHVEESIVRPLMEGKTTISQMVAAGDYNFWPTTDNRPFFYHLEKALPHSIANFVLLGAAAVFLMILFAMGMTVKSAQQGGFWLLLLYFIAIGVAYMLIQVPIIQQAILLLGSPTLSVALVLAVLLLGGSLGSAASQRLVDGRRAPWLGPAVALIGLLYLFLVPALIQLLLPLSLGLRAALFCLLLLPLALAMGAPFPTGLRFARAQGRSGDIPLLYGVNGAASVLGSAIGMAMALTGGFSSVTLMGALLYALLFLAARRLALTM